MKSFYADRISANIARTPQGFLVCSRVPVARTGWQEYRASEIGLDTRESGDNVVRVYRSPEEVFSPETVASGEGQTITDTHPPEFINANNCSAYDRGHAQHVQQGGPLADGTEALVADLFITDATLISKIESGQREISVGYESSYSPLPDGNGYAQKNIRINHIAVVPNGRAGEFVRIRDHKPEIQQERKIMPQVKAPSKESSGFLGLGKLIKRLATTDAEPEDFDQLISLHLARTTDADEEEQKKKEAEERKKSEDAAAAVAAADRLAADKKTKDAEEGEKEPELHPDLKKAVDCIMKMKDDQDEHMKYMRDSMEGLKDHLGIEPEGKESEDSELIPISSPADRPQDPLNGAAIDAGTVDAVRAGLLASKPFIAQSNDAAAKKQWNDAWAALPKTEKVKDSKGKPNGHSTILQAKRPENTFQLTADASAPNEEDDAAYIEKLNNIGEALRKGKVN